MIYYIEPLTRDLYKQGPCVGELVLTKVGDVVAHSVLNNGLSDSPLDTSPQELTLTDKKLVGHKTHTQKKIRFLILGPIGPCVGELVLTKVGDVVAHSVLNNGLSDSPLDTSPQELTLTDKKLVGHKLFGRGNVLFLAMPASDGNS
ncbi:hypothetical protein DPMN_059458 [Dreissena polymorpha]|uniref:Uncharacterized protein n=1 Tax=Dreissena polymorpha TaxID=45954 RepID=A0A9D4C476_DREPO|nr:hypothetical protein DPMN_059458 [Dreissena polymorpha]